MSVADTLSTSLNEALRAACIAGNAVEVRALIAQGLNPFEAFDPNEPKRTAMYVAINWHPGLAFEMLDDARVSAGATQADLNDFLYCSIMVDPRCLLLAVSKGADVESVIELWTWDDDQGTACADQKWQMRQPLHAAAAQGHADLCLKLLAAGHDFEAVCPKRLGTPAQLAEQAGFADATQVLAAWAARREALKSVGAMARPFAFESESLKR